MPKRSITSLGKKWELLNSFWMFWVLMIFGLTNWISFFYIGARCKQIKWVVSGFIYLVLTIQFFYLSDRYSIDAWQYDVSFSIVLFGWIMSIIHAVTARREYLLRLEQEYYGNNPKLNQKWTYAEKRSQRQIPSAARIPHPESEKSSPRNKPKRRSSKSKPTKPVDVNMATVEQLAAIPSIGMLLAAKVVEVRVEKGGFSSFDDFVQQMNVKPHIVVKAKPYLIFPEQNATDEKKERITESSNGRIVDY